jgi:hypothetical protein
MAMALKKKELTISEKRKLFRRCKKYNQIVSVYCEVS